MSLRRRWGFLPWSAPLEFRATSAPQLVTRWETGRTSSRHGPSRDYRLARLSLKVGEVEIPLPAMRGPRDVDNGVVVVDHARGVFEALDAYALEVTAMQAARGRQKVERREARKRAGIAAPTRRSLSSSDPSARFLVASTEGAFDARVGAALGAGLALATALGLAAYFLPSSGLDRACAGLVLPVLGSTDDRARRRHLGVRLHAPLPQLRRRPHLAHARA